MNIGFFLLIVACVLMFLEGFSVPAPRVKFWALSLAFVILWLLLGM